MVSAKSLFNPNEEGLLTLRLFKDLLILEKSSASCSLSATRISRLEIEDYRQPRPKQEEEKR